MDQSTSKAKALGKAPTTRPRATDRARDRYPAFVLSSMRVQIVPACTFCYLSAQVTYETIGQEFVRLADQLVALKNTGKVIPAEGGLMMRTLETGQPEPFTLEVGFPVEPGTQPADGAQIQELAMFPCAALLLWGSYQYLGEAYAALSQAMGEAGLKGTGESREQYLYFEKDMSPNNITWVMFGLEAEGVTGLG